MTFNSQAEVDALPLLYRYQRQPDHQRCQTSLTFRHCRPSLPWGWGTLGTTTPWPTRRPVCLASVGDSYLYNNDVLTNIDGLSALTSRGGRIDHCQQRHAGQC
ncbi:MAG: hypothetical protein R2788_18270 [Saprospiraceae bacterium]